MNAQHHETPFFSTLWDWLKHLGEHNPYDDSPAQSIAGKGVSGYQLRRLERCLQKDCDTEISRKKLERYWQEISH